MFLNITRPIQETVASPGTVVNDTSIGTSAWEDVDNCKVSDNTYTFVGTAILFTPNRLKCTNFGFVIPDDAIILGVEFIYERKKGDAASRDVEIKLVVNDVIVGDDKAQTTDFWGSTDEIRSRGGMFDLWGLTLTPADINSSLFGVVVRATASNAASHIDHIQLKIYYKD